MPVVSEPASNVIGVLTKASNVVHKGRIQLAPMFTKGPIITVLNDYEVHPTYRAVAIDVGAYTTDLAALSLDTRGERVLEPERAIRVVQQSLPFGISNLDARMMSLMNQRNPDSSASLSAKDWGTFQRLVYADGKAYRNPKIKLSIGGPADAEVTQELTGFTKELSTEVEKFCAGLAPANIEELILTGGGSLIPSIRTAVQQAAHAGGHQYVKAHAPGLKRQTGGSPVNKLDDQFTRAGSALGAASIFFEGWY
jgi:hypothetical protein